MSKCLLTGATGFLGRYLLEELQKHYDEVMVLSRSGSGPHAIKADLNDKHIDLGNHVFQAVYHAAGMAHRVPQSQAQAQAFVDTNVGGTIHLLEALQRTKKLPKQFVFISSVSVYGLDTGKNISEEHPLNAKDPYGRSKIKAEEILAEWGRRHKVKIGILRLPLIAGRNAPGNLGAMIKGIRSGKYFRIGKGAARKSIVLAADVAAILPKVAEKGGIYNLTDGYHPTFAELENAISHAMGKKGVKALPHPVVSLMASAGQLAENVTRRRMPINKRTFQKITNDLTFADEKARKELGWQPRRVLDNVDELLAE